MVGLAVSHNGSAGVVSGRQSGEPGSARRRADSATDRIVAAYADALADRRADTDSDAGSYSDADADTGANAGPAVGSVPRLAFGLGVPEVG